MGMAAYKEAVAAAPVTQVTTLSNGFRVATEQTAHKTATVGVYIDAGSRFETAKNNGTAHFLEHMAFKGTSTRSQAALEVEVENMGAMLNAYTSRELTAYYAKCFSSDVGSATEILSDLLLRPTLDAQAVDAERAVILREMQEVNDMPEEVVLDYLHATAYQGTSLGYTILGPEENIETISKEDLKNYIDTYYTAPRMVLAASGGVVHEELVEYAEQYFGGLSADVNVGNDLERRFTGSDIRARDDAAPHCHMSIAVEGCGHTDPDYYPLMVASSIVGNFDRNFGSGKDMSSPLARICATEGFAHSYMSFLTSYKDTGLFGVYAVCPAGAAPEDFLWSLQSEWKRIQNAVTEADVTRAKNQLKASLAFSNDGTTAVCDELGRQMLSHGRRVNPVELDTAISGVTVEGVKGVMEKYLHDACPALTAVGATEGVTDYNRLKSGMSWTRA
jgi:processing peptidase subunit beta